MLATAREWARFTSRPLWTLILRTLNVIALPFFAEEEIPLLRMLTDRGTEYFSKTKHHAYQLYLGTENRPYKNPSEQPPDQRHMRVFSPTL